MTEEVLGYEVPTRDGQPQPRDYVPTFTLKATDRCAPAAILRWVEQAAAAGTSPNKLRGAMEIYITFVQWQRGHVDQVHTPD